MTSNPRPQADGKLIVVEEVMKSEMLEMIIRHVVRGVPISKGKAEMHWAGSRSERRYIWACQAD